MARPDTRTRNVPDALVALDRRARRLERAGTQGVQGPQGAQGSPGRSGGGTQGPQGSQGAQGSQGVQGSQGSQGSQGVAGGGGGGGVTFVGYNTVGGSNLNMPANRVYMKKVTLAAGKAIVAVGARVKNQSPDQVADLSVAIFSDNSGAPLRILSYLNNSSATAVFESVFGTSVDRWVDIPAFYVNDTGSSIDVWIAVMCLAGKTVLYYDGSGSDRTYDSGSVWFADAGIYTVTTGSNQHSIRAATI